MIDWLIVRFDKPSPSLWLLEKIKDKCQIKERQLSSVFNVMSGIITETKWDDLLFSSHPITHEANTNGFVSHEPFYRCFPTSTFFNQVQLSIACATMDTLDNCATVDIYHECLPVCLTLSIQCKVMKTKMLKDITWS